MASPLAAIKGVLAPGVAEPIKPPPGIPERIKRGRDRMRQDAPKRNECLEFARGNQYRWIDSKNVLRSQATTSNYGGKGNVPHRVRAVRNFIFDNVETFVAGAMERTPSFYIAPTSSEPKRIQAARLSRKLCFYGWEQWGVLTAREIAIRFAAVADEGFAWPYFDNTVGPYITETTTDEEGNPVTDEEGAPVTETVGEGEICIRTFGPNEVFWEPGVKFHESRWHAVEQARDIDSVMELEGYTGGKLNPDGQTSETSDKENTQERLVLVTDYLERPTSSNPEGRWVTMANGRLILPLQPYPCVDGDGNILDEPVLHRLTVAEDADSDRGSGLVRHAIDAQRALNHAVSKIAEWINLALNPQVIVLNGRLKDKLTDAPGAVFRAQGQEVSFRQAPPIPPELFRQKEEALADMGRIFGQNAALANAESGRGIEALISQDTARQATFFKNLARFDARLLRHCLYLAQRHYTEPRLLKIKGPQGVEPIADFEGSELLGEVDVRVDSDSLEPRSRQSTEAKILGFAERGWISGHAAMAAINSGTAEGLVEGYERDVARANLVIQKIKDGPELLFNTPPRRPFFGEDPGQARDEEGNPLWISEPTEEVPPEIGPEGLPIPGTGVPGSEGVPVRNEYVPGWMPRPFDDIKVQKDVFADWMKSTEYDDLPPESQEAANAYYEALLQIEAKHNSEEASAQAVTAESLGMSNAAKNPGPPPLPSQAPLNKE